MHFFIFAIHFNCGHVYTFILCTLHLATLIFMLSFFSFLSGVGQLTDGSYSRTRRSVEHGTRALTALG